MNLQYKINTIRELLILHPKGTHVVMVDNVSRPGWAIHGELLLEILDCVDNMREALEWYAKGRPFRDDLGNETELAIRALKTLSTVSVTPLDQET